jgi:hypothetical protein
LYSTRKKNWSGIYIYFAVKESDKVLWFLRNTMAQFPSSSSEYLICKGKEEHNVNIGNIMDIPSIQTIFKNILIDIF